MTPGVVLTFAKSLSPQGKRGARAQFRRLQAAFARYMAGVPATVWRLRSPVQVQDVARRVKAEMRKVYEAAFALGLRAAGADRAPLPNELAMLQRTRRNEYAYLDNFLMDVFYGEGTMGWEKRAHQYANALGETYNMGLVYGSQISGRYLRWRRSRHCRSCPDCLFLSGDRAGLEGLGFTVADAEAKTGLPFGGRWGNGVYSARELARAGVFPQSGTTRCTTECRCHLASTGRPSRRPRRGAIRSRFRSLEPKPFTGTEGRGKSLVVLRQHDPAARARAARRAARTQYKHVPRGAR